MADWTTIADSQVDPNAPVTSELMSALRDNPIAIAEGATGAPSVLPSVAKGATGAIGTYALMTASGDYNPGDTAVASSLVYADTGGTSISSPSPAGTWRCMGRSGGFNAVDRTTVWLRIS